MTRKPNYATILAAHREAALLAQSVLRAGSLDRSLSHENRLDCIIASDALQDAIDMADSRAALAT